MSSLFQSFWSRQTFIWPHKGYKSFWRNRLNIDAVKLLILNSSYFGCVNINHRSSREKLHYISNMNRNIQQRAAVSVEHCITCNKVVDDCVRALICIHGPGYVPNHSTWTGVLRHCERLVRQAATLRCTHTHRQFDSTSYVQITTLGRIQRASYSPVVWGRRVHCRQCPTAPPAVAVWSRKALVGPCHGPQW